MLIEQIIEFQLRGPGPIGRPLYSYNWLISWPNKNLLGKSTSGLLFTAKILQEAMFLTFPYTWTKSLTIKILHHNARF